MEYREVSQTQIRDHYAYALWLCLFANLWLLILDQRLATVIDGRFAVEAMRHAVRLGQVLPMACIGYLVFRLVRPFPFLSDEGQLSNNLVNYWATLVITLAAVFSAATLSWAATGPGFAFYRVYLELALPIITLLGFLGIEAMLIRTLEPREVAPPYLTGGLLAATIMLPALVCWYLVPQPQSGLAKLIMSGFTAEAGRLRVAIYLCLLTCAVWWVSGPLRRKLWRVRGVRAALLSSWIFALTAFAVLALIRNYREGAESAHREMGIRISETIERSGTVLGWAVAAWVAMSLLIYVIARVWRLWDED